MKFLHFIPHVNRTDLTLKAINSVPNLWHSTILIDNTDNQSLEQEIGKVIDPSITIMTPSVPLNTAQTYNWMRSIGIRANTDFITFMHNDCEVLTPQGDQIFVDTAIKLFNESNQKIGWIYHDSEIHEDLFCAYKTEMLLDVGGWDWLACPFYYLDIDFSQRVKKAGWTIQKTPGILCKHHSDASSTIKSDKLRGLINPYYFGVSQTLMDIKWSKLGGDWSNL